MPRMRRALVVIVALAGCGRLGFDTSPPDSQSGDDAGSGSGSGSGTDGGAMPDAAPAACAEAIPISFNTPMTIDTCSTDLDRVDACGPQGTREVVFKFTAPAARGYTIRAYTTGTTNVASSTGIVDASCTTTSSCAAVLGRGFTEGQVVYLAVEASSGTCATIDFLID
jgi:hypothetical protein